MQYSGIIASNNSMRTQTPKRRPLRILLYNVGYATALDGSMRNYVLKFYRYLYTPRAIIRRVRMALHGLLTTEKPDICCFVEVHRRHGFVPHEHEYQSYHMANKYGRNSMLRHLPFFRDNCNGFVSKEEAPFERLYFKSGTKKLVYCIKLQHGITLFLVHFALKESTRKKQCEELRQMVAGRDRVVICGDFNVFKGLGELRKLAHDCRLQLVHTNPTFPAVKPKKSLDLFLCSKDLGPATARVLKDVQVSDHLPVMLEVGV
jgi:endonuclease/exonuclease/phosphatase family metal-dependent hydrolase